MQKLSPFTKGFFDRGLAVVEQDVKCENANLHLDVFSLDILPLSRHKLLERQYFLVLQVPCNRLAVKDETLCARLDPGIQFLQNVGVLFGEVFGVSRENGSKAL